jgi:ABC-2 type transport system permease protein
VIVGASLVGLCMQGIRFLPGRVAIGERAVLALADVARWTPPGMLGRAVGDAGRGEVGIATLELVLPAVSLLAAWWGWGEAHRRAEGRVTTEGHAARPSRAGERQLALLPDRLAAWNRPWLAVASKELRYARRDPRRKVALLNAFVISAGLPIFLALSQERSGGHDVVLYATFAGYFAVLGAMNQFGLDGPALWLDVAAGDRLREVIIGKNVALAVLILPFISVLAIGLASFSGGWAYVPPAVLLAVGGLGAALAVANVVSVKVPQAMPESGNPFGRRGGGQGCINGLLGMAAMLVQGIVISPLAGAATIAAFAGLAPVIVVSVVGLGYGYLVWRAGLALAVDDAHRRQPEMLIAVDPRRV